MLQQFQLEGKTDAIQAEISAGNLNHRSPADVGPDEPVCIRNPLAVDGNLEHDSVYYN